MVTHPTADPEREELFAYDADQDWRTFPTRTSRGTFRTLRPRGPKATTTSGANRTTTPGRTPLPPARGRPSMTLTRGLAFWTAGSR
jgi:hypothetical protein